MRRCGSLWEIDELVLELNAGYLREGCPYHVASIGTGYRLALREEFGSLRAKFYGRVKAARLSQAAIDVLAIVAYKQPISREEFDELRGRPSAGLLSQLVRRGLLQVERSGGKPPRSRFSTTDRFLQLFGLESLQDLPNSLRVDGHGRLGHHAGRSATRLHPPPRAARPIANRAAASRIARNISRWG